MEEDELIKDGFILTFGTMISSVLTFVFHFYTGRALGPASYGIFSALLALVYVMSVLTNTVQMSITNFVARLGSSDAIAQVRDLAFRSIKKLSVLGVGFAVLILILSPFIAKFLHIDTIYVSMLAPLAFFLIVLPLNRGLLQGLQRFKPLSLNMATDGVVKLLVGVLLISVLGLGVNGATFAFTASIAIPFFLAFLALKDVFDTKAERKHIQSNTIYKSTMPIFLFLLSVTIFYTIDIVLVKHFFEETVAGHYGAGSLLGKIIFFGMLPLIQVMYAKVSKIKQVTKESLAFLKKTILLIITAGVILSSIYFLFSNAIINIVFGPDYGPTTELLGWFGLVMGLFTIVYALSQFLLAVHKKKFIIGLFVFNIIEVLLIWFYHPSLLAILKALFGLLIVMTFFLSVAVVRRKRNVVV